MEQSTESGRASIGFLHNKKTAIYLVAFVAALLAIAVYIPALANGFVEWDDSTYVVKNNFIHSLDLFFFKKAFLDFYAANWHPLTWLSHAIDYRIWRLDPFGHHLTSVVLHGINVFLVVVLVARLMKPEQDRTEKAYHFPSEKGILVASVTTGLLFGIHPLHVESVAWIAERKDVLCAFFYILSLIAYANSLGEKRSDQQERNSTVFFRGWYLTSFVFFIFSLMSKPMAVSLPAVLLIIDWYPFRKFDEPGGILRSLREKIPFFVLSIASALITVLAQKSGHALISTEITPLSVRIAVGFRALLDYLGEMVLPLKLIPLYPYPHQVSFFSLAYSIPLLGLAAIILFCAREAKKGRRFWAASFSYYAVTLLPVLGFIRVGSQAMADRYTYLPSLGPFLLAGIGCAFVFDKYYDVKHRFIYIKVICVALLFLVSSALLVLTRHQIGIWQNGVTLWTREIEYAPEVITSYNNRGLAFMDIGKYSDAIKDFTTEMSLMGDHPGYLPFYNRARAFAYLGRTEDALKDADRAVNLSPSSGQPYYIRGKIYMAVSRDEEAVQDFTRVIQLTPRSSEPYFNRAISYFQMARYEEAVRDLTVAIDLNPGLRFRYYGNRAIVYEKMGMYKEALEDYSRALAINADSSDLLYYRGNIYLKTGNNNKALADFTDAIALSKVPNPLYLEARSTAYRRLGLLKEARRDAAQADDLHASRGKHNPSSTGR